MKKQYKKPLLKPIKEECKVEITTSKPEEDFKDVDLYIEFKSGTLKGMKYRLCIDYEDYGEVWCG